MAGELYTIKKIFQKHGKGLRAYPFATCTIKRQTPGSSDTILFEGMVPDNEAINKVGVLADEHEAIQICNEFIIDPPFIYDDSIGTGMRFAI